MKNNEQTEPTKQFTIDCAERHRLRAELHRLIGALGDLDSTTSMHKWLTYWEARVVLADYALHSYREVFREYARRGDDYSMPVEGFSEIMEDLNVARDNIEPE
jgi:hypothetical protein